MVQVSVGSGRSGSGGPLSVLSGRSTVTTGGIVSIESGEGTATTSGVIAIRSANSGASGVSGRLVSALGQRPAGMVVRCSGDPGYRRLVAAGL